MPAFHVFPGGCLETQDYEIARRLGVKGAHAIEQAAYRIAAIRETAEESGLLLAKDATGMMADRRVAQVVFEALRQGSPFADVLALHTLTPHLDALRPVSWWITPEGERLRYDTRFFWAEAPPDQQAAYDGIETTDGVWMTALDALAACQGAEITLAPPTLATLEQLHAARSPAAFAETALRDIQPLCPHPTRSANGQHILVLPGDPRHPGKEPQALPHRTRFIVLEDGRFM